MSGKKKTIHYTDSFKNDPSRKGRTVKKSPTAARKHGNSRHR